MGNLDDGIRPTPLLEFCKMLLLMVPDPQNSRLPAPADRQRLMSRPSSPR
jgi:hypothetical protein